VHRGVYAVGRRQLTQKGRWIAALLACGQGAALSHDSAAELWGLVKANRRDESAESDPIHVTVPGDSRSRKGIKVHRRKAVNATTRHGIRVTTPAQTLIDVAPEWDRRELEQAIGEADLRRICSLKALRTSASNAGRAGAPLRAVIEPLTFRVTQSELERAFLRLVAKAGLPLPDTQARFGNTRVDFWWSDAGLVVETDGAQFHANAIQQTEDRKRDHAHIRAGRIPLRVTHWQVFKEPAETTALLADVFTSCRWRRESESTRRAA
jgi:very-short-patch-repair endonuclease